MTRHLAATALLAFLTTACGEEIPTDPQVNTQTAALLPPGDSLIGTWKSGGWPGIVSISGGDGYMTNDGDGCWLNGDLKFENITPTSTPDEYTATRHMYGSGFCLVHASPETTIITLHHYTSGDAFSEVSPSFSASWTRYP